MKSKIAIAFAAALLTMGVGPGQPGTRRQVRLQQVPRDGHQEDGSVLQGHGRQDQGTPDADLVKKLATGTGHPKASASEADLTALVKWIKSL